MEKGTLEEKKAHSMNVKTRWIKAEDQLLNCGIISKLCIVIYNRENENSIAVTYSHLFQVH